MSGRGISAMRILVRTIIAVFLGTSQVNCGQPAPVSVQLPQLVQDPSRFKDKLVRIPGFLVIDAQPKHGPLVVLFMSQQGAMDANTKNQLLLIPGRELMRNRDKFDHQNVYVVGICHVVSGANGSVGAVITDIGEIRLADP
jgi:hypothetical protein